MLVLTRNRNQAVLVGNDVKLTVLDIRRAEAKLSGAKVKLGFDAPKEVCIQREEISQSMKSKGHQRSSRPKPHVTGRIKRISDAVVRLQIQTPRDVSTHCSRASETISGHRSIVPPCQGQSISAGGESALDEPAMRVFNCRQGDNILIGNRLLITIVDVYRFIAEPSSRSIPANVTNDEGH